MNTPSSSHGTIPVGVLGLGRAGWNIHIKRLNDRHPGIGTAGGVHGWLEKKRAACEEAEQDPLRQFTAEPDKGHRRMLQEFFREIRGERGPVCPVSDAVTATRICLAAAKSYIENRPVMMVEIASTEML